MQRIGLGVERDDRLRGHARHRGVEGLLVVDELHSDQLPQPDRDQLVVECAAVELVRRGKRADIIAIVRHAQQQRDILGGGNANLQAVELDSCARREHPRVKRVAGHEHVHAHVALVVDPGQRNEIELLGSARSRRASTRKPRLFAIIAT